MQQHDRIAPHKGRRLPRPDEEVVDQGLSFDIATLMGRRQLLRAFGLGSVTVGLAACGAGSGTGGGGTPSITRREPPPVSPEIHRITEQQCTIGENPLWDASEERLYWIDVAAGTIYRSTADGRELQSWNFPGGTLSSLALRDSGGAIVTAATGIHLYDFATGETDTVFELDGEPGAGFNDGKADRQGRFVTGLVDSTQLQASAGSPGLEHSMALYTVDRDLQVQRLADGFTASNGPCFSPDGTTLYWNDSWALRSYAFDYDPVLGRASNRRVLVEFTDPGAAVQPLPDGATVDEEGCLWTAALYAGEIHRYTPDGTLDRVVPLPLRKPLGVAFGGPDMDILYVTTMGDAGFPGVPLPAVHLDGSVLAVHGLGVRGIPETRFAG